MFGTSASPPRSEWIRTPLAFGQASQVMYNAPMLIFVHLYIYIAKTLLIQHVFPKIKQPYFQELPYGLRCPRNATRGLQSVVQAFIIKQFLFDNRPKQKSMPLDQMLKPTEVTTNCFISSLFIVLLKMILVPGKLFLNHEDD